MMLGTVNARLEPILTLTLLGGNQREEEIDVMIDTGFNGGLAAPARVAQSLGWILQGDESVVLADGSEVLLSVYRGIVTWNGQHRITNIITSESKPLVGTSLLDGNELKIDFRRGGTVSIAPLS